MKSAFLSGQLEIAARSICHLLSSCCRHMGINHRATRTHHKALNYGYVFMYLLDFYKMLWLCLINILYKVSQNLIKVPLTSHCFTTMVEEVPALHKGHRERLQNSSINAFQTGCKASKKIKMYDLRPLKLNMCISSRTRILVHITSAVLCILFVLERQHLFNCGEL